MDVLLRAISRPVEDTSINFTYESGDERDPGPFRECILEPLRTEITKRPDVPLKDNPSINSLA